ncbi:hypothetical protein ACE6H2_019027 [Prunus campanulata]
MATVIRYAIGKLGNKYSSRCHNKGRIIANKFRVKDFQIRSAVPHSSYGYSSCHHFLFGNHHKKPPPILHLQYLYIRATQHRSVGCFGVASCSMDGPNIISLTNFTVKEYNKEMD